MIGYRLGLFMRCEREFSAVWNWRIGQIQTYEKRYLAARCTFAIFPCLDFFSFPASAAGAKGNWFWKRGVFLQPAPRRRAMHAKACCNLGVGKIDG